MKQCFKTNFKENVEELVDKNWISRTPYMPRGTRVITSLRERILTVARSRMVLHEDPGDDVSACLGDVSGVDLA